MTSGEDDAHPACAEDALDPVLERNDLPCRGNARAVRTTERRILRHLPPSLAPSVNGVSLRVGGRGSRMTTNSSATDGWSEEHRRRDRRGRGQHCARQHEPAETVRERAVEGMPDRGLRRRIHVAWQLRCGQLGALSLDEGAGRWRNADGVELSSEGMLEAVAQQDAQRRDGEQARRSRDGVVDTRRGPRVLRTRRRPSRSPSAA